MGKAAERRKKRRQIFLTRLAVENPERFETEWAKRVESWAGNIWLAAKGGRIDVAPVFIIADRAETTLKECGEKAIELQFAETSDILRNECSRALAPHIGHEIYKLNQRWERREK